VVGCEWPWLWDILHAFMCAIEPALTRARAGYVARLTREQRMEELDGVAQDFLASRLSLVACSPDGKLVYRAGDEGGGERGGSEHALNRRCVPTNRARISVRTFILKECRYQHKACGDMGRSACSGGPGVWGHGDATLLDVVSHAFFQHSTAVAPGGAGPAGQPG